MQSPSRWLSDDSIQMHLVSMLSARPSSPAAPTGPHSCASMKIERSWTLRGHMTTLGWNGSPGRMRTCDVDTRMRRCDGALHTNMPGEPAHLPIKRCNDCLAFP